MPSKIKKIDSKYEKFNKTICTDASTIDILLLKILNKSINQFSPKNFLTCLYQSLK